MQLNLPTILRKSLWHAAASDCLSLSLEKIELLCSKMPEDLIRTSIYFSALKFFLKRALFQLVCRGNIMQWALKKISRQIYKSFRKSLRINRLYTCHHALKHSCQTTESSVWALWRLSVMRPHMWWKCFESCKMAHGYTMAQLLLLSLLLPGRNKLREEWCSEHSTFDDLMFFPLISKLLLFEYIKGVPLAGFFALKYWISIY